MSRNMCLQNKRRSPHTGLFEWWQKNLCLTQAGIPKLPFLYARGLDPLPRRQLSIGRSSHATPVRGGLFAPYIVRLVLCRDRNFLLRVVVLCSKGSRCRSLAKSIARALLCRKTSQGTPYMILYEEETRATKSVGPDAARKKSYDKYG
jgi:hypothetical protein